MAQPLIKEKEIRGFSYQNNEQELEHGTFTDFWHFDGQLFSLFTTVQSATQRGQTVLSKANALAQLPLATHPHTPYIKPSSSLPLQVKLNPKTLAWPVRPWPRGLWLAHESHP